MISYVNITTASIVKTLLKLGVINIRANQAAERLPVTADNALRKASLSLVTRIF